MMKNQQRIQFKLPIIRASFAMLFSLFVCLPLHAYEFKSTSAYQQDPHAMQATQVNATPAYQSYESTIYTPFSNETPGNSLGSLGGEISSENEEKDGFIKPDDPGEKTPIGDAWSLLIFAALAAGVVYFKRRSATKKSRSC